MRVVAGTLGGRRINAGDSETIRPTADRVREAMFNSLYSIGAITDAVVLDLFAGSGALGIEALSRGAARVVFVENDRQALKILRENLASLGLADQATVVPADGSTFLAHAEPYDLLLLDPPYSFDCWPELLAHPTDSVVAIESDREIDLPKTWDTHRVRSYGGTVVTLAFAPAARKTQVP
ncbi:MAG: 16S rRNA (guanine(966)-N(2))-methyltransferase RsmD [Acidimicrobiaceae bacterium]|nr:16S rRNA (guanine(966)-N(2))-methyltransferase RsmD [Acidimicrobiaceae bacterium]MYG54756.1 16S rRNA (guanine(966)-N(2))-methyltransferase RsmD [Acidimicrobiaceae bacterium]MYJ98829.1 16S rRNA (guanine(966)-N(2))-methyltransferase RsmD [Acidimicrobiaceae bacterium]